MKNSNATIRFFFVNINEQQESQRGGFGMEIRTYMCAGCGKYAHARVLAKATFLTHNGIPDGEIYWCYCPCGQPTVIQVAQPSAEVTQHPTAIEFQPGQNWPDDLVKLFREAAMSFSANAFTACAMVCRKILMLVACTNAGAKPGKPFTEYVDEIVNKVVPIASARTPIDAIRTIGNDASHELTFVTETDARRAIGIVLYVLNAAYSLPRA